MPRPTSGTTIQRPDLGAIAFEYMLEASQRGFIGLDIMPIFETAEKQADYPVIPIESLLKLKDTKRAPRGNYPRSGWEFETGTYNCQEYGWEELIDDVERNLYKRFFDSDELATMRAVDQILRSEEKRIADMVFNTSNLSNSDVTTEWSTAATATPRADVAGGKVLMKAASGLVPNVLAMSDVVFNNVLLTAEITDALKYTNPIELGGREAQRRILAQYFGVEEVLVGGSIYDNAKKGQSFSITDIWNDEYIGLLKVARNPRDLKEPSLGRTFLWVEDSPQNLVTESYREEDVRSDVIRTRHNVDEVFVFTGAGYLRGNITA